MSTSSVSSSSSTSGPAITFSGLASGLDVSSIIDSLMQAEAAPQTAIKNRVTAQQAQMSALQAINTALASISTAADSFKTGSTWTQMTATSSSSAVTVAASSSAAQGTLSLTVNSIASAAQLGFASSAALTDVVTTPNSTLDITLADGSTSTVATGDGTLSSVISALNGLKDANGKPVLNAAAVNAGGGQYRLLVSAASTGAGSISIAPSDGSTMLGGASSIAGSDASISLGAGITVTSKTNTFTSLVPGIDVTLTGGTPIGTPVQVTVADDGSSRANGIKQFVSQINSVLSQIGTQTAYGTNGSGGGVLAGNAELRGVVGNLVNTIFPPDGTTLANYGLDVDKDGNLTFDSDKFEAAYQADPAGVQAAFTGTNGWISRVQQASDAASLPASGSVSQAIKSLTDEISQENDEIATWDDRLAVKQQSLQQIYTNLETTLSTLQSQQSWLSSALSSLDGGWSFSNSSSS